ncbi:MAG: GNAT family N-acetyltransferase [Casimicrobiaceae bacterium]|nr:GNAT family N-acetyltransferase [Casimicrobiaceae bacterium]MCX8099147.1 GNAT family N-acetyltransferase [Casimicrobiaceae bacterium]MDW8311442.1 GNAT family N-acyltransferase [Burkholderiales bacterium]
MLQSLPPLDTVGVARPDAGPTTCERLAVRLAQNGAEVRAAQRLRYRVFCEEMGASIGGEDGLDVDLFDPHCEHLIVIDRATEKVVGTYRILPPWGARRAGGLYCEREFRIEALAPIRSELFELGRACIHPAWRDGSVLAKLWSGLGQYVRKHRVRYLLGCASVPLARGSLNLGALRAELLSRHLAPAEYRVEPIRGLRSLGDPEATKPVAPPLLRVYLSLGAWICGEAAWDPDFDCADFLVLLPIERLSKRAARHFLGVETAQ